MKTYEKIKEWITNAIIKTKNLLMSFGRKVGQISVIGFKKFTALPKYFKTTIVYVVLVAMIFSYVAWQRNNFPLNIFSNNPPVTEPKGNDQEPNLPGNGSEDPSDDGDGPNTEEPIDNEPVDEEPVDQEPAEPVFNIRQEIIWPTDGLRDIEGKFKQEFQLNDGSEFRLDGILIPASKGSKVRAALPGEVVDVKLTDSDLYGGVIKIRFQDPTGVVWETIYYNVEDIKVEEGDTVSIGDNIASVSSNDLGTSFSQEHLVFELKRNGQEVDPELYY